MRTLKVNIAIFWDVTYVVWYLVERGPAAEARDAPQP
jgi:hypothetical protein